MTHEQLYWGMVFLSLTNMAITIGMGVTVISVLRRDRPAHAPSAPQK